MLLEHFDGSGLASDYLRAEGYDLLPGGEPDCVNCGCVASAGLEAISRHRLPGGLSVGAVFDASRRVGNVFGRVTTVDAA